MLGLGKVRLQAVILGDFYVNVIVDVPLKVIGAAKQIQTTLLGLLLFEVSAGQKYSAVRQCYIFVIFL